MPPTTRHSSLRGGSSRCFPIFIVRLLGLVLLCLVLVAAGSTAAVASCPEFPVITYPVGAPPVEFGSQGLGTTSQEQFITVHNPAANGALQFTATIVSSVFGSDTDDFAVTTNATGDLDPDEVVVIGFVFRPTQVGVRSATLEVAYSCGATESFAVTGTGTPVADLAVGLSAQSGTGKDKSLTYTATATNSGPSFAQNVQISLTLAPEAKFVSATRFLNGSETAVGALSPLGVGQTGTLSWTLSGLASGDLAVLQVVVELDTKGQETATSTASASSTTEDLNLLNNSASLTTNLVRSKK